VQYAEPVRRAWVEPSREVLRASVDIRHARA
jgi:hypothetical protein